MEIHLPEDLQRFVHDQIRIGRFSSEDQLVRTALEQFQRAQQGATAARPTPDPWLGSMRDEAELLDEVVEDAMTMRAERPWRRPAGE